MRRGHAGPAVLAVLGNANGRSINRARDDPLTRSHYVRLHTTVGGGAFRGKVGDAVGVWSVAVGRADCDCQVGVPRVGQGAGKGRALHAGARRDDSVAGVACGDNNDDTALYQAIHFGAERTLARRKPARVERVAQTHVEAMDVDVASMVVELLDVSDRGKNVADVSGPLTVENLQAHQLAAGRHAAEFVAPSILDLRRALVACLHVLSDLDRLNDRG